MRPEVLGEAAAMLEKFGLAKNTSCTETIRNHDARLQAPVVQSWFSVMHQSI